MIRDDKADVVYKTEPAKFDAVVEDIWERFEAGQPVSWWVPRASKRVNTSPSC